MWKPIFKGDFKKLIGKKVKITHGIRSTNIDQFESEGKLLDIFFENEINQYIILIKLIKSIRKYGKGNIFVSKQMFLPIKGSQITNVEIECFKINDLIKQKSIESLCLDVSEIILAFSGNYIDL
tara:strand:- start:188 stop:559 length:372 start_codon:yes stop_codon:yes gene_type:complete